jgi:hypothetical protein
VASRWLKCSCTSCDATWRMSRHWIDHARGRLSCPVCSAPGRIGDPPPLSPDEVAACHAAVEAALGLPRCRAALALLAERRKQERVHALLGRRRVHGGG